MSGLFHCHASTVGEPLPQELIEHILAYIGDNKATLLATSLTARSFVRASQLHLFHDAELYAPWKLKRLLRTANKSSHLALSVKKLSVGGEIILRDPENDELSLVSSLAELLGLLTDIEYFALSPRPRLRRGELFDWPKTLDDPTLVAAIQNLAQRTSFEVFSSSRFRWIPPSIFGKAQLKRIELSQIALSAHWPILHKRLDVAAEALLFNMKVLRNTIMEDFHFAPCWTAGIVIQTASRTLKDLTLLFYCGDQEYYHMTRLNTGLASLAVLNTISLKGSCGKLWAGLDMLLLIFSELISNIPQSAPLSVVNIELYGSLEHPDCIKVGDHFSAIDECIRKRHREDCPIRLSVGLSAPEWIDCDDPRIAVLKSRIRDTMLWSSISNLLDITVSQTLP